LDQAVTAKLTASTLTDLGEVIRLCEAALEKGLDEGNTQFANQLLASSRVRRGTEIAEKGIFKMPPDPRWPQYRTMALEDLEKAILVNANQPDALLLIARLNLLPEGNAERAAAALDQAIDLTEDDPRLRATCLTLRAGIGKDPAKQLADLDEAVRVNPNDAVAVRTRGSLQADRKNFEAALVDMKKALDLEPDHAPTHQALALILIELKRFDEALAELDAVRALEPKSVVPLVQKARVYALESDFEAALKTLDLAHSMDSGNLAVLLLRASVYQELKKSKEALADIDRVLELQPGLPMAMRFRAMLLAGSDKIELAIDQLKLLAEATPGDLEVMLQLALFYSAEEKPYQAIEYYSAVLEKDPNNLFALRGRGDAHLGIGRHAEAIADLTKALQLEPEDPGILNNLAWVLATSPEDPLRDGKKAIELATKACELTEYKAAHILSTLASAYAETGDFETAIKWSTKAVELGSEEQKEPLQKELQGYKEGKPFREKMTVPEPKEENKVEGVPSADKPASPEAKEPKPDSPKPDSPKPDTAEPDKPQPKSEPKPE
jgi:tetratricopeptide (TPR) repeat protein